MVENMFYEEADDEDGCAILEMKYDSDEQMSFLAGQVEGLRNGAYADFDVIVGPPENSTTFHVNKLVLQLSSTYFDQRISAGHDKAVYVPELQSDIFEVILHFLQTGAITITTETVVRLLAASRLLSTDNLMRHCEAFLMSTLCADNCLTYWNLAKDNELLMLNRACKTLTASDFYAVMASPDLIDIPEIVMRTILLDNDLDVRSEDDVLQTALKWMDGQALKKDATVVYDLCLFKMIRWRGVSDAYVRRLIHHLPGLSAFPAVVAFLYRVLEFHDGGSPFPGLLTTHRPKTGMERYLLIAGVDTGSSVWSDVVGFSLQKSDVGVLGSINTRMQRKAAACICPQTNTLFVSGTGASCNELWKRTEDGCWNRCGYLQYGRRGHSMVCNDEKSLFIVAGYAGSQFGPLSSVEKYDTRREICTTVGDLVCPVDSAACIADRNILYLFGGRDTEGKPVDYVQTFDTIRNTSTMLVEVLPRPAKLLRAVLWDRLVILIGFESCFIFNLDSQTWSSRIQFSSGTNHFGAVIENSKLFIFGGGRQVHDAAAGVRRWNASDRILWVPIADILEDSTPRWIEHGRLPIPTLVYCYGSVTAAAGSLKPGFG